MYLISLLSFFVSLNVFGSEFFKQADYHSLGLPLTQRNIHDTKEDFGDHFGNIAFDEAEANFYVGVPDNGVFKFQINPVRVVDSKPIPTRSNISIIGDVLLVIDTEGVLHALDKKTLETMWKLFVGNTFSGKVSSDNQNRIFLQLEDESVTTLDLKSGRILWQYRRSKFQPSSIRGNFKPFVHDNNLLVGTSDGYLLVLRKEDGSLVKEVSLVVSRYGKKYFDVDGEPVKIGNKLLVSFFEGDICLIGLDSFTVDARVPGGTTRPVALEGDTLIVSSSDGMVKRLDAKTLKTLWQNKESTTPGLKPVIIKNEVFVARMKGAIDVLDLKTGKTKRSLDLGSKGGIYADPVHFKSIDEHHLLIMNQSKNLIDYWLKL